MALVDEIKEKLLDNEYKLLVEEIAEEEKTKTKLKLSRIKVAAPYIRKDINNDYHEDDERQCYDLVQEIFIFIVPNSYLESRNLLPGKFCSFRDLYRNSLTYEEDSFMDEFLSLNIGDVHVHNQIAVIIEILNLFNTIDEVHNIP
jgi:hypothetical protein